MTSDQLWALDHLLDDHYALWDFGDGLPQFHPDANQTKISELVELVRLGLVRVTYGLWHVDDTESCEIEAAIAAISNPEMWSPTDGKAGYVVELSSSGYETLRSHGIGGPKTR